MNEQLEALLRQIIHPETEQNIVDSGFVDRADMGENGDIAVTLRFSKARDPFAQKIKGSVERLMAEHFPSSKCMVIIREAAPKPRRREQVTTTGEICNVIAIASGKGGVGKSTVTANLAVALRQRGYNVGILDADIYGPSQTKMFGVEGFLPEAERDEEGNEYIIPAQSLGIKLMSIGFFIRPTDALMWRGGMAVNALHQLIHQTQWGKLDYLLIDLPPGTGDISLDVKSIVPECKMLLVTTPHQAASHVAVKAGHASNKLGHELLGVIENMSYFIDNDTNKHHYIFGKDGGKQLAEELNIPLLGQVPLVQSIREGGDEGTPIALQDGHPATQMFESICQYLR